jgi:hypothetical protein
MPHSPRWYQDKLWLLNSGKGELGYVDLDTGKFNAIATQWPSRLWRPLETGLDSVGAGEPRALIPSENIDKPAPTFRQ